ncbi:hypothetical protein RhiirA4_250664 [Rhizophagus irregularis]|uniref:Uncharacterized protein n=1 Tax=Rhizophagus irregularis TaxID=588596 RepID=A0A2I1GT37_9GLOM|nr:hypothetical protein RhiirA4_250664 [Rhizophagus irregularis]
MLRNGIPEKTWSKLLYSDFWEKPVSEWGGVENWELYYNKKNPTKKTVQSSHNSLRLELEALIKYGDKRTKAWKKAYAMSNELKTKILSINVHVVPHLSHLKDQTWSELNQLIINMIP